MKRLKKLYLLIAILLLLLLFVGIIIILQRSSRTTKIVPSTKKVQYVNTIFPMDITIRDIHQSINAAQIDFHFDPSQLEVTSIDTTHSFMNIIIDKKIDNYTGQVMIAGGLPNPGYIASEGLFATVYFKPKKVGKAQVLFLPDSIVLTNDGKGGIVSQNFSPISYEIRANK